MRLDGKTALVTGATTGIGFAAAERLIAEGADPTLITGRDADRLAAAAARLGPSATPLRADLATVAGATRLAADAAEALDGRTLDILFANAGVGGFAPFEEVEEDFFDDQFALNVKGVFFTVQKLLPLMAPGGSVVLNASAVNGKGLAGAHVYNATKAAVRSLARSLAAELGPRGIRVNSVSPGYVPTPFQGKMGLGADAIEGFEAQVVSATPLGRTGGVAEIGAAVAFLASADAAYVSAVDLTVDGGWSNV